MRLYGSTGWQFDESPSIWARIFTAFWGLLTGWPGSSVAEVEAAGESPELGIRPRPAGDDAEPWDTPPVAPINHPKWSGRLDRRSLWFMADVQFEAVRYIERTGKEAYVLGYSLVDGREVTHYCFLDGYRTTSEDAAATRLVRMNAEIDGLFR